MIPQLVTVRYRRPDGRWLRRYVPVVSELLVLVVQAWLVACLVFRVGPVGARRGTRHRLWALPSTRFEIEDGRTAVLGSVR